MKILMNLLDLTWERDDVSARVTVFFFNDLSVDQFDSKSINIRALCNEEVSSATRLLSI